MLTSSAQIVPGSSSRKTLEQSTCMKSSLFDSNFISDAIASECTASSKSAANDNCSVSSGTQRANSTDRNRSLRSDEIILWVKLTGGISLPNSEIL